MRKLAKRLLYVLSNWVKKDPRIWVFGAWMGRSYSDNSKYLFEYVRQHYPGIQATWITRDNLAVSLVRSKGYPVLSSFSVKGIWTCMRAQVAVVCVEVSDLPSFAISPQTMWVHLWHGLGPKGYKGVSNQNPAQAAYDNPTMDLVVTTSKLGVQKMQTVFGSQAQSIEILGYPRHASLLSRQLQVKAKLSVLYAPTHRSHSQGEAVYDIDSLARILPRYPQMQFLIKLHGLSTHERKKLAKLVRLSNCQILTDAEIQQDVYTLLPRIDVLLTDYSSIYTDYLLTGRPIIFMPFDRTRYAKDDQGFFLDYEQVTPGPKAKSWDEALSLVLSAKEWSPNYVTARKRVLSLFHEVRDRGASGRIYRRILAKLRDKVPDRVPHAAGGARR